MNAKTYRVVVILVLGIMFIGCAAPQYKPASFTPQQFDPDRYVAKVDNALILFDASSSMTEGLYKGRPKIHIAKDFVYRMNQTLPKLNVNAGLRTFGQNASVGPGETALVYGMTGYSRAGLKGGLDAIEGRGGYTPISAALAAAHGDLSGSRGPIAVILVSDGEDPHIPDLPLIDDLRALKNKYGDRLCIYTVGMGNDRAGLNRLREIAEIGGCGFYTHADELATVGEMADFVEKVFLAERPKPAPKPEPKPAMPMDSDGDGVYDDRDKCPGTPKGAIVDADGCWVTGNIHFDFDKSDIKPQYESVLNEIASVMKRNPMQQLRIHGHTDSIGTEAYNQGLSERRARSAEQYLIGKGVDPANLSIMGHSFRRPIATNETDAGRAQNRRAEFEPIR